MNHVSGSARRPVDHSTDSNAARPAQHPAIIRPYMTGDAYAECLSTDAVEAFFQQRPATELTGPEMSLLNSRHAFRYLKYLADFAELHAL